MEHLRKHTKEYVGAVHGFLDDVYFSKLPSASDYDSKEVREAAEMEEEEDSRGNNAKRAAIAK